jgi:hypothetical protein
LPAAQLPLRDHLEPGPLEVECLDTGRSPDGVNMAVQGERMPGGFILITSLDGIRYAVRP